MLKIFLVGLGKAKNILRETLILPNLRPDLFTGIRSPPRGNLSIETLRYFERNFVLWTTRKRQDISRKGSFQRMQCDFYKYLGLCHGVQVDGRRREDDESFVPGREYLPAFCMKNFLLKQGLTKISIRLFLLTKSILCCPKEKKMTMKQAEG